MKRSRKLVTAAEAAQLVGDGDLIAIGGIHAHSGPTAIIHELIRAGRRDLTVLPNVSAGLPVDLLIAAGAVREVYACYIGLEHQGLAPAFRSAAETGTLAVRDVDEPFVVYGLKAASANLPFMPLPRGHRATDTSRINPDDYRLVKDPATGLEHVAVPAVRPRVGLIHAPVCDVYGNVHLPGPVFHDDLIAKASEQVIVTTDRIVETPQGLDGRWVSIPGFFVTAVVQAPFAAHPTSSAGLYHSDEQHLQEYARGDPAAYLERFVHGVHDHLGYLEQVGLRRLTSLLVDQAHHLAGTGRNEA